jgi:riboflavin kinase/FMN adenylyltransferase
MQIIENLDNLGCLGKKPLVAIGVFDGVHRGHQQILRGIVKRAAEKNSIPSVFSFYPHPQKVIASGDTPPLLQTFIQKAELMQSLGIELFFRMPFTRKISLYKPEVFVEKILSKLVASEIHVGNNFRFGHRRSGNIQVLEKLGSSYGFKVCSTSQLLFRGSRISSTRIRRLISNGQISLAKRLLGRPYEIRGTIVRGAERGATLGFPTANLHCENELIPPKGVYVTRTEINGEEWIGATNIGFRPTVHGFTESEPTIETHLLDFSGNLYGKSMKLSFCFRLRDEKKFENVDMLVFQINRDIKAVRRYSLRIEKSLEKTN